MKPISLIANSGIQFITIKANFNQDSEALKISSDFFEKEQIDEKGNKEYIFVIPYYYEKKQMFIELTDEIIKLAQDPITGQIDEDKIPPQLLIKIPEHKIITVRAREALQMFENTWLPIPYFRRNYDLKSFQQGPETWAMIWYNAISGADENSQYTHNIVLAFDTRITENQQLYLTPTPNDAQNSVFDFAPEWKDNSFLIARDWLQHWLKEEFEIRNQIFRKNFSEYQFIHTSYYLTLLKILQKANILPRITLHTHNLAVDVDLILDIGNSRTTGILVETVRQEQKFQFTDAIPLQIRDITYPDRTYNEPFEMRSAFVKATLGNETAFALSGNPDAFKWPSLVRIGPEAQRMAILSTAENSNSFMSSPKRYLWDNEKRVFPWTYISKKTEIFAKPALYGISELFTEDGTYLERQKKLHENDPERFSKPIPAINPYYSRASIMTFAFIEIFLQAIIYVNSYEFRKRQGQENLPRKLKRIVITCPTAMLQTEQITLRQLAADALAALKQYFGDTFIDPNLKIIPDPSEIDQEPERRTEWTYDEATCNQLAFIYGEIKDKFLNNAHLYIKTVGKIRKDSVYPNQPALTIASIDIGGGTTDLMIASYQVNPNANISILTPNPLFWEGFNLAGDDIVKRIIERIILPKLKIEAEKRGAKNIINTMNFLFGPYLGKTTAYDKLMKKQFANQIAIPIAFEILQHASEEQPNEIRSFQSFFINYHYPHQQLIDYINRHFREAGATDFNIEHITLELNTDNINLVVKDVVEKMIKDLSAIIAQYKCDYIILSGRPSNLPIVRDLFLKFLPVTPDKIIKLGNYRIGTWYPFATETGVIKDPKTTVVVGATVALMAGTLRRLEDFTIDTSILRQKFTSTADFIGEYDPIKARLKNVYLSPNNDSSQIQFYGHLVLGRRQMPSDEWISAPMYKITYSDLETAKQFKDREPLKFELERDPRNKEKLRPLRNIEDKDGKKVSPDLLRVKVQTLSDDTGYWIDTGIFLVQIFE